LDPAHVDHVVHVAQLVDIGWLDLDPELEMLEA
jgi:hypothetical protein